MNHIDVWISVFCIVVGVVMVSRWILRRRKYRLAASWPVETGHLESSGVVLSSGGGQPGAAAYFAELRYSYAVQGNRYTGFLRRRFLRKGSAERWVQQFTANDMLTVRYSPEAPGDSVLRQEDQAGVVRIGG